MHNDVARPWSCSHAHIQNGDHKGVALFRDSGFWILKAQTNHPSRNSTAQPYQKTCRYYCHLNFQLRENTTPYWIVRDYNPHNARSRRESLV